MRRNYFVSCQLYIILHSYQSSILLKILHLDLLNLIEADNLLSLLSYEIETYRRFFKFSAWNRLMLGGFNPLTNLKASYINIHYKFLP